MKLGSILTLHSSEVRMVLLNGLELESSQNYELSRESSFMIETCINHSIIHYSERNPVLFVNKINSEGRC